MSEQYRPVWLTRAEYLDWKKGLGTWALDAEKLLDEKWDAAPADPTEATYLAVKHYSHDDAGDIADAALRALGMPNA